MGFGEETRKADFLPKKPHSWEDMRKAVRPNLDATVNLIPPLPTADITLQSLEHVEPGTYALSARPRVATLRTFPNFRNGEAELGLFCINKKWLLTIAKGMVITLPDTLTSVQHDGLFQADIHSHPGDDPGSTQASREDVAKLASTKDGKIYIISSTGLHEFQRPTILPGGFTGLRDIEIAWKHWITEDLKLTEDEFNKRGGWKLRREYYEKFFGMRTISWDKEQEIDKLLASKESL